MSAQWGSGGDRTTLDGRRYSNVTARYNPHLAVNRDTVVARLTPADNGHGSDLAVERHCRRYPIVVPNLHSHALTWIDNHTSSLSHHRQPHMVAQHFTTGADKARRRHGLSAGRQRPQDTQIHKHDSGNVDCKLLQIHLCLLLIRHADATGQTYTKPTPQPCSIQIMCRFNSRKRLQQISVIN